jgi:hypothetical protein
MSLIAAVPRLLIAEELFMSNTFAAAPLPAH